MRSVSCSPLVCAKARKDWQTVPAAPEWQGTRGKLQRKSARTSGKWLILIYFASQPPEDDAFTGRGEQYNRLSQRRSRVLGARRVSSSACHRQSKTSAAYSRSSWTRKADIVASAVSRLCQKVSLSAHLPGKRASRRSRIDAKISPREDLETRLYVHCLSWCLWC